MTGLLVEVAATGRHDAVPGIGIVLLLQPPRPPLRTKIRRSFFLSFTFCHSTTHNPTIPPSSTHDRTLRFCLTRKKQTLPAHKAGRVFVWLKRLRGRGVIPQLCTLAAVTATVSRPRSSRPSVLVGRGGRGGYNRNATCICEPGHAAQWRQLPPAIQSFRAAEQ